MENQELCRVASTFGFKCIPLTSHMIIFMKYFKTDLSLKYFEVPSSLFSSLVCLVAQWCPTLCDPIDYSPPGSSVHGDSPVKNTGVGCHALLQEIFQTQGLNPGIPPCSRFFTIWATREACSFDVNNKELTALLSVDLHRVSLYMDSCIKLILKASFYTFTDSVSTSSPLWLPFFFFCCTCIL